jgi:predicted RNA binding protein YcfA (HicA-like mRNA interferase family)
MTERLPRITAKDVLKVLERTGFSLARQSGSHMIYKTEEGRRDGVYFKQRPLPLIKSGRIFLKSIEVLYG